MSKNKLSDHVTWIIWYISLLILFPGKTVLFLHVAPYCRRNESNRILTYPARENAISHHSLTLTIDLFELFKCSVKANHMNFEFYIIESFITTERTTAFNTRISIIHPLFDRSSADRSSAERYAGEQNIE